MKEHFTRLFEYNLWANKKFSEVLRANAFQNPKILKFVSHIANAQIIWLSRIKDEGSSVGVWEEYDLKEALELLESSSQNWLDYIYSGAKIDGVISYKNSRGQAFESRAADILTHVANHGTHHRGQIALMLREENIAPPASDFIFYVRA
ncbi:MAG: hypothetical protein HWE07_12940 [Cytophagia bacterium]|nr:hypothetical protein [Cytophagia bacterium]